ncbi:uncharacterized protein LOC105698062 [Orussus abietinus]|uniref:uncharacterized protein LOC105698062 n=1 Tax=Orussus abietinus TaxID=222816 RepID=UPI0006261960|nr:uncharacterized protein LOC105698062 [Orussus abietinus]
MTRKCAPCHNARRHEEPIIRILEQRDQNSFIDERSFIPQQRPCSPVQKQFQMTGTDHDTPKEVCCVKNTSGLKKLKRFVFDSAHTEKSTKIIWFLLGVLGILISYYTLLPYFWDIACNMIYSILGVIVGTTSLLVLCTREEEPKSLPKRRSTLERTEYMEKERLDEHVQPVSLEARDRTENASAAENENGEPIDWGQTVGQVEYVKKEESADPSGPTLTKSPDQIGDVPVLKEETTTDTAGEVPQAIEEEPGGDIENANMSHVSES